MDVTLALLCDAANVTADRKLNVLGTFDTIGARSFPTVHSKMSLVLRFSASPAEAGETRDITVRALTADGVIIGSIDAQMTVPRPVAPGAHVQMLEILELQNTVFEGPGDHAFHILIGQDEKTVVPLTLVLLENTEEQTDDF